MHPDHLTSHEKLRSESRLIARLVIIDGPDSWAKELVTEKIAEKFYGIDFTDESTIFDRCLAKIKEAEKVTANDCYNLVGGLSGLGCQACVAIHQSCLLHACHIPLMVQSWHCIPWCEAVHAVCNYPTCSYAFLCCICGRSLVLDAAQMNSHLVACLADAGSAPTVQELGQVDGVCSFWEAAQSLVASLAERMGLLAHTPDAVEAAREKQVQAKDPTVAHRSLVASA